MVPRQDKIPRQYKIVKAAEDKIPSRDKEQATNYPVIAIFCLSRQKESTVKFLTLGTTDVI